MKKIYPNLIQSDRERLEKFLKKHDLKYEDNIEATFIIEENKEIIASASSYKNIIKCVAIDKNYQGGPLLNQIISEIMNEIYSKNFDNIFIYTKTKYKESFLHLGFKTIEEVDDKLVFMEKTNAFKSYLEKLKKEKKEADNIGAIVMNANPFTLGHLYLAEYAAKNCDFLYIFIVSEDLSIFSTRTRYELAKKATKNIKNLKILPTCDYIVSSATFPSYFIKEEDDLVKTHSKLDSLIFKNHIGKILNINKRFVGEEKHDKKTNIYNQTMKEVFSKGENKIELIEIERKKIGEEIISASKVRKLIKNKDLNSLEKYLPESTFDYIKNNCK